MAVDEWEEVGVDFVTDAEGMGVVVDDSVTDAGDVVEEVDESEATPVFETTSTDAATLDGTSAGV